MASAPLDVATLLSHESFVRGLARRLVHGEAEVDDVVQETWLSAIHHPPEPGAGLKGWLATVARNVVRQRHRADTRRTKRETIVARPEGAPSETDLLEREEARRKLVAAVLRLEPPYRDPVALRWFEGRSVEEVAARLSIPKETAKTRLRRALEMLRTDLDRSHGGNRAAWCAILAPLAGPPPTVTAPMPSGGSPWLVPAAAAVAVGATLWFVVPALQTAPDPVGGPTGQWAANAAPAPEKSSWLAGNGARAKSEAETARTREPGADRPLGRVTGIVADPEGLPVAGARVSAEAFEGVQPAGVTFATTCHAGAGQVVTDATGAFVIPGLPLGAYRLEAIKLGAGRGAMVAAARTTDHGVLLRIQREVEPLPAAISVLVRDEAGFPVAGARVEVVLGVGRAPLVSMADAEGIAAIGPFENVMGLVTASGSQGVARTVLNLRGRRSSHKPRPGLVLTLVPAGSIAGRLLGPSAADLPGTVVEAWSLTSAGLGDQTRGVAHSATAAQDGTYRIDGVPAGTFTVFARSPAGLRVDVPRRSEEWSPDPLLPTVEVRRGEESRLDLRMAAGGTLRGTVTQAGASGQSAPVAGARVEVSMPSGSWEYPDRYLRNGVPLWRLDSPWPDDQHHPFVFQVLTTDAQGSFEAKSLYPGPYRVRVIASGLSLGHREGVPVEAGAVATLALSLAPAGTLEAVLPANGSYGLRLAGSEELEVAFIAPGNGAGAIKIPGLAAGAWELCATHSDGRPPLALVPFTIRANETTYLDATDSGSYRIAPRILRGGVPVAGARVYLGYAGDFALTGADGRVEHRVPFPWIFGVAFGVESPEPDAIRLGFAFPGMPEGATEWAQDVELPRGEVVARVFDARGAAAPGVDVRLTPMGHPYSGRANEEGGTLSGGSSIRSTDAQGRVVWKGLPSGEYVVQAFDSATQAQPSARGSLESGGKLALDLPEGVTGSLRVHVRDAAGQPLEGVELWASTLAPEEDGSFESEAWRKSSEFVIHARSDGDGLVRVTGLPVGFARFAIKAAEESGRAQAMPVVVKIEPASEGEVVLRQEPLQGR